MPAGQHMLGNDAITVKGMLGYLARNKIQLHEQFHVGLRQFLDCSMRPVAM